MERLSQQRELAQFLRRHREERLPSDRHPDRHRRAIGLRRSEVADLVGISEQWYTRLEQGRAQSVSTQVLHGIAGALSLSAAETEHLFILAGKPPPEERHPEDAATPKALLRFIDLQSPCPSYVIDHHWDTIAYNDGARAQLHDLEGTPRNRWNVLLQIFTEPYARELIDNWESHAKTVLAFFRRDYGRNPGDPRIREVVAELEEKSEEFRRWWPLQEVEDHVSFRFQLTEPGNVRLTFDRLAFICAENPNLRVVTFVPVPGTDTMLHAHRLVAEYRARKASGAAE
jgi:transcriptional regulator with XRE-family HTH domain